MHRDPGSFPQNNYLSATQRRRHKKAEGLPQEGLPQAPAAVQQPAAKTPQNPKLSGESINTKKEGELSLSQRPQRWDISNPSVSIHSRISEAAKYSRRPLLSLR